MGFYTAMKLMQLFLDFHSFRRNINGIINNIRKKSFSNILNRTGVNYNECTNSMVKENL